MPRRLFIIYTFCCVVLNLPISASNAAPIDGQTYALDVFNSFAYLGVGRQLVVFDVTDPRAPVQVAEVEDLGDSVQDIQVIGDLAFIATGTTGLHIIDVSIPAQPVKISSSNTPGMVTGVYVADGYAYLAAGGAGLLILDVSDPANPTAVAQSRTLDWDTNVVVSGGYAYVASGEEGVRVVDITDPTKPLTIGRIQTPNDAMDVFVDGDHIFIAAGSGGLQIVNISDPFNPQQVAVVDTGYTRRVHVDAGFAYVATERNGVWAISISNPVAPRRNKRFNPQGSANSLAVEGDYIYVADGVGGLLVLHLSSGRSREIHRGFTPALPAVGGPGS